MLGLEVHIAKCLGGATHNSMPYIFICSCHISSLDLDIHEALYVFSMTILIGEIKARIFRLLVLLAKM